MISCECRPVVRSAVSELNVKGVEGWRCLSIPAFGARVLCVIAPPKLNMIITPRAVNARCRGDGGEWRWWQCVAVTGRELVHGNPGSMVHGRDATMLGVICGRLCPPDPGDNQNTYCTDRSGNGYNII